MNHDERIATIAQKASERMRFFISLIFNMAAIAPSLTWPLFINYIADYFSADVSGSSFEV